MSTEILGTESVGVEDNAAPTVALVRAYLPNFQAKVNVEKYGWWSVELPCPASADYQFSLHGELGGERQISARRTGFAPSPPRNRFWYFPMELADFRDNTSKLERLFQERVKALMSCPTRILESKGVVLLGYRAEYQTGTVWQHLGGLAYLGVGLGIPFVGRKRIFISPPVVSCAQE